MASVKALSTELNCRDQEREAQRRNGVKDLGDLRMLAKNSLHPIDKKLRGIYSMGKEKSEKEISTSSLVQILIQEATDEANLVSSMTLPPLNGI